MTVPICHFGMRERLMSTSLHPVDTSQATGREHECRQADEQQARAQHQCIVLGCEQTVERRIQDRQCSRKARTKRPAPQHRAQVEPDQADARGSRDEIGRIERDVLAQADQQKKKIASASPTRTY